MTRPWLIYLLTSKSGAPLYVGATCDLKRRLKEHSKRFGRKPPSVVLERGEGEGRAAAEARWIAFYKSAGVALLNRTDVTSEGRHCHLESTKKRLARIASLYRHSPETRQIMSERMIGLKHDWTPEGFASAARTQYGPGYFEKLNEDQKRRHSEAARRQWDSVSPEERTRLARERNLAAWANRTPEQRAAIGRKIADARARNRRANAE